MLTGTKFAFLDQSVEYRTLVPAKNSHLKVHVHVSSYLCKAAAAASPKILMEMGLRASLGWGDFPLLLLEEGEGERAAAGL